MCRKLWACLAVSCLAVLAALPLSAQDWRPVGPPGGDVRSLAVDLNDPRLAYLGVSDRRIFGSRDAEEHWQLLGRVGQRFDSVVMES